MPLVDPAVIQSRYDVLQGRRHQMQVESERCQRTIDELQRFLGLEAAVLSALDHLDRELFREITSLLEEKLSIALQEILEQNIQLKVHSSVSHGSIGLEFSIDRNGNEENIMKGSGGSVANVLSVGLRLFALTTLDESVHRRFLVLDEQDCWLRPDLVTRFVKVIHEASKALGFQVLMISHHSPELFMDHADRVFDLEPSPEGIKVRTFDLST